MARTNDPDSADGQFFINLRDNHRLDYGIGGAGYAVFGEVVEGMDVVDRIAAVPTASRGPHENVPQMAVVIKKAREVEGSGAGGRAEGRGGAAQAVGYSSAKAFSSSSALAGSSFRTAASPLRRA